MSVDIHPSWKSQLLSEFEKPYFLELTQFVKAEYAANTCFPKGNEIFAAFDHCPFDAVKVVIIGQDPYHGPGQANGLCFSVNDGIRHPPSLVNIFKEIKTDLGATYPKSGNLERLADQGVLLLNATLTVRAHQSRKPSKEGMGNLHRCRNSRPIQKKGRPSIFTLGRICQKKVRIDRFIQAPYIDLWPSVALKREQGALVRK